jgi:hypothetical protein
MALSTIKRRLCKLESRAMDASAVTAAAVHSLNVLHVQFMDLLTQTLDAAEGGISLREGVQLGVRYTQAGVAILGALQDLAPEVRVRLRVIAPRTRFVVEEEEPF